MGLCILTHQQGKLEVEEESGMCLLPTDTRSTCRRGGKWRGRGSPEPGELGRAQRGSLSSQASHQPSFLFILAPSRGTCLHTQRCVEPGEVNIPGAGAHCQSWSTFPRAGAHSQSWSTFPGSGQAVPVPSCLFQELGAVLGDSREGVGLSHSLPTAPMSCVGGEERELCAQGVLKNVQNFTCPLK